MTYSELVGEAAASTNLKKKDVKIVTDAVFQLIAQALAGGDSVLISRFGTFCPRQRAERMKYNPVTGQLMTLPATTAVAFTSATALKDRVNAPDVKQEIGEGK